MRDFLWKEFVDVSPSEVSSSSSSLSQVSVAPSISSHTRSPSPSSSSEGDDLPSSYEGSQTTTVGILFEYTFSRVSPFLSPQEASDAVPWSRKNLSSDVDPTWWGAHASDVIVPAMPERKKRLSRSLIGSGARSNRKLTLIAV